MKITSLSEKLILYFVLLGIGAIVTVSAVAFFSTREALINRTFDQLTSIRIVKENQIAQFYSDRSRDIQLMAEVLFPAGHSVTALVRNQEPANTEDQLKRFRPFEQYFTAYYLFGRDTTVKEGFLNETLAGKPPNIPLRVRKDIWKGLENKSVVINDFFIDPQTGTLVQLMAAKTGAPPDGLPGEEAMLVLSVSIEAINGIMLNNDPNSGLGLSGETYLVGPDYLMRSESRFRKGSVLRTLVGTEPARLAMAGSAGSVTANDYRNVRVLSSYGKPGISGLNWLILAEIDEKEAMIPVYDTRTRILLISSMIILVFFGFVMVISRRIVKPLIRLKNATINLGEGRYGAALPVTTSDEIGMLTRSFNVMAQQIREKTTELRIERFGRMRSVFDGEEMERQRLSRELHDGIGQSLIAVKLRLENLLYQDEKDIRSSIPELKNYFDQIIDEVRRISNNLMPSVLEVFSIPIAFRNLFTETEEHSSLKINFEAKGNFDDLDLKIKTYIYRLAQEALNNIVKHAEAGEVRVSLSKREDRLTLVIQDDGKGFKPDDVGKEAGNGIHNMRERATLLRGQIEIRSAPMEGTTITLNVPLN